VLVRGTAWCGFAGINLQQVALWCGGFLCVCVVCVFGVCVCVGPFGTVLWVECGAGGFVVCVCVCGLCVFGTVWNGVLGE